MPLVLDGTNGVSGVDGTASNPAIEGTDSNTGIFYPAADTVAIGTGGTERLRVDSSGNVGIGTSSPASIIHATKASGSACYLQLAQTGVESWQIGMAASSTALAFLNSGSERARIDSAGQFLIGTTTSSSNYGLRISSNRGIDLLGWGAGRGEAINLRAHNTSNADVMYFNTSAAQVGSISITASATSYVTSSDYRLKENVQPMIGALAKVAALKPCTYTWKIDGELGEGFIAHELQEVCPGAVTGEKDAVNEDGSIKPQGIDTSFLVATLTAAIQELNAKVEAQAAEIAALKGNA